MWLPNSTKDTTLSSQDKYCMKYSFIFSSTWPWLLSLLWSLLYLTLNTLKTNYQLFNKEQLLKMMTNTSWKHHNSIRLAWTKNVFQVNFSWNGLLMVYCNHSVFTSWALRFCALLDFTATKEKSKVFGYVVTFHLFLQ